MYSLVRNSSARALLLTQAPALGSSLVIAEVFYKFGSFTLECLAFLATWGVADLALTSLWGRVPAGRAGRDGGGA